MRPTSVWAVLVLVGSWPALPAQTVPRQPILLDTDIGSDIDDAFALALLLASPEADLRGISVVGAPAQHRALLVGRFLTATGRRHTPVAVGADPQPRRDLGGQHQYYYHPDALFHRTRRPEKESAVAFLHARLRALPGKVTLLATGPLTNIARLLQEKPECRSWIRRVVLVAANGRADPGAMRTVLTSGVPLVVVSEEVTAGLKLGAAERRRIFAPGSTLSRQVEALYQLWDRDDPEIADVLAAALCLNERPVELENRHLETDDSGEVRPGKGKPNARVVTAVRRKEFLRWFVERLASCVPPERNPARLVPRGGMPHRFHVAEDFETDIERRWWMSGKPETRMVPPGSRRACRGVLTHDFDDLLGNPRAMYTAVIFNPVPGPPMGRNTRLTFRYWLAGSDRLRVQIYSLTNGYHRHLVLTGLPQKRWHEATVDLTAARRADGTGGPLSEGERIDDIQFYTSPDAELILDDIVLYDAAPEGETRPFPRHVHFTGGFDTGAQGKEWPGSFTIATGKGYYWHAARSVANKEHGAAWLRLHLRGERPLGERTRLSFRHLLTGSDRLRLRVLHRNSGRNWTMEKTGLEKGEWGQTILDLAIPAGTQVDEIHFLLEKGAELLLDDVLLYDAAK